MSGNPGGTDQTAHLKLVVDSIGLQEAQQLVQGLAKAIEQSDAALQKMQSNMVKLANQMAQQSGSGASFQSYPQVAQHLASSGYSNVQQLKAVSPPAYQLMSNIQSMQQAAQQMAQKALQQPAMAQHVAAQHGQVSHAQLVQDLAQRVQLYHATGGNPQAWSGSIGGSGGGGTPGKPPGPPPPGSPPPPGGGGQEQQMQAALRQQYQRYQLQRQGVLNAAHLSEKQGGFDPATKATLGAGSTDIGFLQQVMAKPEMSGKAPAVRKALDELAALDKRITQHFNDVYSTLRQANSQVGQTPAGRAQVIGSALGKLTDEDKTLHQQAVVQSLRQWALTGGSPAYSQAQQGALAAGRRAGLPGYDAGQGPLDLPTLQQHWGQLSAQQQAQRPDLRRSLDALGKQEQAITTALGSVAGRPDFAAAAAAARPGDPKSLQPVMQMLQQALGSGSGGKRGLDFSDASLTQFGRVFTGALGRAGFAGLAGGGVGRSLGMGALSEMGPLLEMLGVGALPAGLAGGAVVGGLGLAEAISANRSGLQRQTTALSANVSGLQGNPMTLGLDLAAIGTQFGYDRTTTEGVAAQLGLAGVSGGRNNANLAGATQATLGLAAVSGLKPQDIAPLTASLFDAGQNVQQVVDTFRDLQSGADDAGTSLGQLVQDMSTLQQSTGIAAISAAGLAAVQHQLPPGVNAGQVLAPAMGATGFAGLQTAGVLGISTDQLLAAQGYNARTGKMGKAQPQVIWDAAARFSRQYSRSSTGIEEAIGVMGSQGLHLLGLDQLSPAQQASVMHTLQTQGSGRAEQLARHYTDTIAKQGPSGQKWLQTAAASGRGQVDALTIVAQNVDLVWTTGLNKGPVAAGAQINQLASTPAGQALRAGVAALPGLGPVTSVLGALGALFGGGTSKGHPGGAGSDVGLGTMGGGVLSQQVGISLSGTLQVNDAHGRNVGRVQIDNSRQPVGSKTAVVKLHPLSQAHVPPHGARPT